MIADDVDAVFNGVEIRAAERDVVLMVVASDDRHIDPSRVTGPAKLYPERPDEECAVVGIVGSQALRMFVPRIEEGK